MRRFVTRLLLFSGILLLLLEAVFRTVVPAGTQALSEQDPETGLMRYNPRGLRDGVRTVGRLGRVACRWHINNCGWNSPVDYLPPGPGRGPMLAVIGDSNIEGYRVDAADNLCAELRRRLPAPWQVYSFGQPGSSLAHSLYVARYATRFQPAAFVLYVAADDLCGSLSRYGENVFNLQLAEGDSGLVEVPLTGVFRPNPVFRWLRQSAFLRYLFLNVEYDLPHALQRPAPPPPALRLKDAAERTRLERAVARFVVQQMEREHPGVPVYYVVDGPRADIYAGKPLRSRREADYLRAACGDSRQSHVIDLAPVFAADWAAAHQRLDYADDEHWNARAHGLCARVVRDSLRSGWAPGEPDETAPFTTIVY